MKINCKTKQEVEELDKKIENINNINVNVISKINENKPEK